MITTTEDRLESTREILDTLIGALHYRDSFGVHGSDFLVCNACYVTGKPGKRFEHDDDCPVLAAVNALKGLDARYGDGE